MHVEQIRRRVLEREIGRRRATATVVGLLLLGWASCPLADDGEILAMRRVRLTTVPAAIQGCTRVGFVRDDSVKDLRRKIVRAGGDTAVLSFGIEDMSEIYAEVFRCPAPATRPPDVPRPPDIPPPPPGPPPPPPPGVPR